MNSTFITHMKGLPSFVFYSNNKEYRQIMRDIFQMDQTKIAPFSDLSMNEITTEIDDESKDEMQYDMKQMDVHLSELYDITKSEPKFMSLYKKAAAQMLSEDPLIGQVVLCSYDYFNLYYSCLWFYLHGGHTSLTESVEYKRLAEMLK